MAKDLLSYLIGYTPKWVKKETDKEMLERIFASLKDNNGDEDEDNEDFEEFMKQIRDGTANITNDDLLRISRSKEETKDIPSMTKIMKQAEKSKISRENFKEMLEISLSDLILEDEQWQWFMHYLNNIYKPEAVERWKDKYARSAPEKQDKMIRDVIDDIEYAKEHKPEKEFAPAPAPEPEPAPEPAPEPEPEGEPDKREVPRWITQKLQDIYKPEIIGKLKNQYANATDEERDKIIRELIDDIEYAEKAPIPDSVKQTVEKSLRAALQAGRPPRADDGGPTISKLTAAYTSAQNHVKELFNALKEFASGQRTVGDVQSITGFAQVAVDELSNIARQLRGPLAEAKVDADLAQRLKKWIRIAIHGRRASPGQHTEMSSFPAMLSLLKSATQNYLDDPDPREAMKIWDAAEQMAGQIKQIEKIMDELATISPKARLGKPLNLKARREVKLNLLDKIWKEIKPGDDPDAVDIEVVKNILRRYRQKKLPLRPKSLAIDLKVDEPVATQFIQRLMQAATPMESIRRSLFVSIDPIKTNREFSELVEYFDDELANTTIVMTESLNKIFGFVEKCRQQLQATK